MLYRKNAQVAAHGLKEIIIMRLFADIVAHTLFLKAQQSHSQNNK